MNRKIAFLLGLTLIVKLIFGLTFPVVGDEAYYWFWGQNIQLSYFDHPGMVAWLTALSSEIHHLFPSLSAWVAARLVFVLLSTLTLFVWIKVFLLQKKQGHLDTHFHLNLFVLFFMLNPFLGVGSVLITPDAPLMLFWGLSSYAVLKIDQLPQKRFYVLLGTFLGLGFCSKYHVVLFPLVTFVALMMEKKSHLIFNRKIILTLIFGLIFSAPVLIWNFQNDFSSFRFQLNHGFESGQSYKSWWTSSYLLGQILIFNPVLLFALITKSKKSIFDVSALGQWLFFLYSSFKAKVEANWPITSHASGLVDFVSHKKIVRWSLIYFAFLWLMIGLFAWTPQGQERILKLPTSLTVQDIMPAINQYRPLYGASYQIAGLLSLYTDQPVYKLYGLSRYDFFDSLPKSKPQEAKFYVLKYTSTSWPLFYENYTKKIILDFSKHQLQLFELNKFETQSL